MQESKDIRVELIAAELITQGIPEDKIVIQPIGTQLRAHRTDFTGSETKSDDSLLAIERHILYTTREGLYDMLPQGLFHQSSPPRGANEKEVLEYFKTHKKEEKAARNFFLPYENALYRGRVDIALAELAWSNKGQEGALQNVLARYWPIFQLLNRNQTSFFLKLLPVLHELRGNQLAIEELISTLLEVEVETELVFDVTKTDEQNHEKYNCFGKLLGVNFVAGRALGQEALPELHLRIGPLSPRQLEDLYDRQKISSQLLVALLEYLLPVDLTPVIHLIPDQQYDGLRLPDSENQSAPILGVGSYL